MANEKRRIDANELKREMYLISHLSGNENICIDCIVDAIDDAPTVDAVEVVHGRWEFVEQRFYHGGFMNLFRCSECKSATDREHNYCPNCGAKMDGERRTDGQPNP